MIGGIKFVPYEAESIVPFVANSPLMKFFLPSPHPNTKKYMSKEGSWFRKTAHGIRRSNVSLRRPFSER